MRKVVIDCDPGHDDVIAIFTALAHKEEFEILGITTVAGNNTLEKVTNNILKTLDFFNISIPVSKGFDRPYVKEPEPQPEGHGESGMDGPILPEAKTKPVEKQALEFLKDIFDQNDKITILALGPLTNVAKFIEKYPECKEKIECIALMGGSVYGGNIQLRSEFNIYHDPEAARIVFDSEIPCIMAGLEVCKAGSVLLSELERFKAPGKLYKFFDDLMSFYCLWPLKRNLDRTSIFDVTPVIYLLKPEIFTAKQMQVKVELNGEFTRGMTVCDEDLLSNKTVLLDVDREKFVSILYQAMDDLNKIY